MVKQGIINLNDPIEKYLPVGVKVPQYNGTKITLENLTPHLWSSLYAFKYLGK
jgi:serine-type D-Ala-D-Ala carboxypeptidase/endopeptidase